MPTYAQVENNIVTRVVVAPNLLWCTTNLGGTWLATNTAGLRKNFAGIGYTYDSVADVFIPPKKAFNYVLDNVSATWTLNEADCIYVPIASEKADDLSRGIYALIYPGETGYYCGIVGHNTRPEVCCLQLQSTDTIPLHVQAQSSQIVSLLSPFVPNEITQAEVDAIANGIATLAGQSILITDFIPASWQQWVMTETQARAAGYRI